MGRYRKHSVGDSGQLTEQGQESGVDVKHGGSFSPEETVRTGLKKRPVARI